MDAQVADAMNKYSASGMSTRGATTHGRASHRDAPSINFDAITTSHRALNSTLRDYYLTPAVKQVRANIDAAIAQIESEYDGDRSKFEKDERYKKLKGLQETMEQSLSRVLRVSTNLGSSNLLEEIYSANVAIRLGGLGRGGVELLSNTGFAVAGTGRAMNQGRKFISGNSMLSGGRRAAFLTNVGSSQTGRLTSASTIAAATAGEAPTGDLGVGAAGATGRVGEFLGSVYRGGQKLADLTMTVPDQALGNPVWFGSFQQKFESITGRPLTNQDVDKIIANDEAFMRENQDAITRARNFADRRSIRQSATISSFLGKESFKGSAKDGGRDVFRASNSYMRNFLSYEYETVTQAIQAGIKNGEMSKQEAVGVLAGSLFRMSFYTAGTQGILKELYGFMFGDDEEEAAEKGVLNEEQDVYVFENYGDIPEDIRELKEVRETAGGYVVAKEDLDGWFEAEDEIEQQQFMRGVGQTILFGVKGGGGGLSEQLVSFGLHQAAEEEFIAELLGTYDPENQTYKPYENSVNYSRLGNLVDKIVEGKEVNFIGETFALLLPQLGVSEDRIDLTIDFLSERNKINSRLEEVDEDGNFVISNEEERQKLEDRRDNLEGSMIEVGMGTLVNYALQIPGFNDYIQYSIKEAQQDLYEGQAKFPTEEEKVELKEELAPLNKKDMNEIIETVGNRSEGIQIMLDYKSPHSSNNTIQDEIITFEIYGLDAWANTFGKNVFDPSTITSSSKEGPYANFLNTDIDRKELLQELFIKLRKEGINDSSKMEQANAIGRIIARDY